MSFCQHKAGFSFDKAHKEPAPPSWGGATEEVWVCDQCGFIHHTVQREVEKVRGPVNARQLFHAQLFPNGRHLLHWKVGSQFDAERTNFTTVEFFPWPRRPPLSETESLIHLTWELLMSKMSLIMEDIDPWSHADMERHKAQTAAKSEARGIAEVLAIQMKPFMESPDHVVRCAVKKFKDPEFEVPGLGAHLWDPMRNPDGSLRVAMSAPKPARTKPVIKAPAKPKVDNTSTKRLTAEEAAGIKEAVGSGMFSKEDVAAMFKVSLPTVEEAIAG